MSWQIKETAFAKNDEVDIGQRLVSREPMVRLDHCMICQILTRFMLQYIIINLGISMGFGGRVDFANLVFPTTLRVDYVRVYQDPKNIKTSCDPPDAPTAAYIEA